MNKNARYPIGHPTIITQPRIQDIASYFGIASVDILAPAELFHPVLPVRSGNKLTFPLCAANVKQEQDNPMLEKSDVCNHTPEEPPLRGTWCTPEIEKAVEKGYRVIKIHEVWPFCTATRWSISRLRQHVAKAKAGSRRLATMV